MRRLGPWSLACALLAARPAPAQTLLITAGLGAGTFLSGANEGAGALVAGVTYGWGANELVLRTSAIGELFGSSAWDAGLLYGRVSRHPHSRTAAALGVGLAGGCHAASATLLGGTCTHIATAVALPLDAAVTFVPASAFAIGLDAFADISPHLSYVAAALVVQVGKVR